MSNEENKEALLMSIFESFDVQYGRRIVRHPHETNNPDGWSSVVWPGVDVDTNDPPGLNEAPHGLYMRLVSPPVPVPGSTGPLDPEHINELDRLKRLRELKGLPASGPESAEDTEDGHFNVGTVLEDDTDYQAAPGGTIVEGSYTRWHKHSYKDCWRSTTGTEWKTSEQIAGNKRTIIYI